MSIFDDIKESLINFISNNSKKYKKSDKWLEYLLGFTKTHCDVCFERNYKIYTKEDHPNLPEHIKCACHLDWLRMENYGTATSLGNNGADYHLYINGSLPNYYISKDEALKIGWKPWLGNLDKIAPGKMIGGDRFYDRSNKLPSAPGREWYECDIDYNGGYRNNSRLIYSNDGLVFKTDSHYSRFISIE